MQAYELTATDLDLNWDNAYGGGELGQKAHTDSIPDALLLSLSNRARVDIEYMMEVTGADYMTVINALKGAIYQDPEKWNENLYEGWVVAEEYLSGNLRRKLRIARKASKQYNGRFNENVYALRKLLPETVGAKEIYVTLGSPWVPVEVIEDFMRHILKSRSTREIGIRHDERTGTWEIPNKTLYAQLYSVSATNTYGTSRITALDILERTLNMRTIAVYDESRRGVFGMSKKRVLNRSETVLALEKQQKMLDEFRNWVWKDRGRKELLERIYDNKYACVRKRIFDGSFLTFPGLSEQVELYPYQKNAVARILFSPNTLLAHDVGSGKTYVMIAAGMELRRMGISKKNLYVVPNNIVSQWKGFFESMYPTSKVFCVDAKNFTPNKRKSTLESVRDGDFDAVIMAYSCFERIPLSKGFQLKEVEDELGEIDAIESQKKLSAALRRKKETLLEEKAELELAISLGMQEISFDELGITRLFVDEAHNFKNVPIETKTTKVLGISATGSKKCKDMMDKVRYVQKQNGGGGVVMATGTPITNSLTDAFVIQKYLQSGELAMLDLQTFDSWIGMFAERVTEFEVDVDTNGYRLATRFSKFHNLPELTAILSSIADFHQTGEEAGIPAFDGYTDTLIPRSGEFVKYLDKISARAEMVRGGHVDCREDNMLKITTDGRKAALDLRLVDQKAEFTYQSKVAQCAHNVLVTYMETKEERSTQLVFCDSSTPKPGYNVYDELKRMLLGFRIPEEEIAFVHDAATDAQRAKLFAKVRSGEVRILIGSTFKLGTGVNVQDRLIAVHHLDLPWRPADLTQREGRILRQGNCNAKVKIFRYVTEGSFDAYSWQLLETKQRFISELLAGSLSEREGMDVDGTALNYAEIKALAIGNPLVKERVEVANELTRMLSLRRKAIEAHICMEKELLVMPAAIEKQKQATQRCLADLRWYRANRREYDKEERKALRLELAEAITAHLATPASELSDRIAMSYQGFDVLLPANMAADKPHMWLCHEGRYYVELGESEQGALVRIDNFLDKLSEHHCKLGEGVENLKRKYEELQAEIAAKEDYHERIEALQHRLEKLDKKLGVKQK